MKQVSQRILAPLMALLVLMSSVSWTVDMHLCMGRVVDMAVFGKAQTCGMDAGMSQESKHGCCDEESYSVQAQDELMHMSYDLDLQQQVFLVSAAYSFFLESELPAEVTPSIQIHPPPELGQDLLVLYETFLI